MVKKYLHSPKLGFLYVRVRGKYLGRITADEGTAEFDRQYWDILSGKELKTRTSWTALIANYRGSDRWAKLKPRTRSDYEKVFHYLEDKNAMQYLFQTSSQMLYPSQSNLFYICFEQIWA